VEIALSFTLSTGTSVKDFLSVSRNVPPGGYAFVLAMVSMRNELLERGELWENEDVVVLSRHWELRVWGKGVV
jgi:hypothetical protein